jgi:hypothetical protein
VARTEINLALEHSRADALQVREVALCQARYAGSSDQVRIPGADCCIRRHNRLHLDAPLYAPLVSAAGTGSYRGLPYRSTRTSARARVSSKAFRGLRPKLRSRADRNRIGNVHHRLAVGLDPSHWIRRSGLDSRAVPAMGSISGISAERIFSKTIRHCAFTAWRRSHGRCAIFSRAFP